jgi:hypothetical protein
MVCFVPLVSGLCWSISHPSQERIKWCVVSWRPLLNKNAVELVPEHQRVWVTNFINDMYCFLSHLYIYIYAVFLMRGSFASIISRIATLPSPLVYVHTFLHWFCQALYFSVLESQHPMVSSFAKVERGLPFGQVALFFWPRALELPSRVSPHVRRRLSILSAAHAFPLVAVDTDAPVARSDPRFFLNIDTKDTHLVVFTNPPFSTAAGPVMLHDLIDSSVGLDLASMMLTVLAHLAAQRARHLFAFLQTMDLDRVPHICWEQIELMEDDQPFQTAAPLLTHKRGCRIRVRLFGTVAVAIRVDALTGLMELTRDDGASVSPRFALALEAAYKACNPPKASTELLAQVIPVTLAQLRLEACSEAIFDYLTRAGLGVHRKCPAIFRRDLLPFALSATDQHHLFSENAIYVALPHCPRSLLVIDLQTDRKKFVAVAALENPRALPVPASPWFSSLVPASPHFGGTPGGPVMAASQVSLAAVTPRTAPLASHVGRNRGVLCFLLTTSPAPNQQLGVVSSVVPLPWPQFEPVHGDVATSPTMGAQHAWDLSTLWAYLKVCVVKMHLIA